MEIWQPFWDHLVWPVTLVTIPIFGLLLIGGVFFLNHRPKRGGLNEDLSQRRRTSDFRLPTQTTGRDSDRT